MKTVLEKVNLGEQIIKENYAMGKLREENQKGKQYDHEQFMHDKKTTEFGGLERHDGAGDHYKDPHKHSQAATKMESCGE